MIEEFFAFSAVMAGITVFVLSLYMRRRYTILSRPFLFLGISFLAYGLAELIWYLYDFQEIEAYGQLIPDALYTIYYGFAILHVYSIIYVINNKALLRLEYAVIGFLMLAMLLGIYTIPSIMATDDHEQIRYGGYFVTLASILAALSIITMLKLRASSLEKTWLLIGGSILIASLVDVWYYTAENVSSYEYGQYALMDWAWLATDILMIIGIILHRRKI